MPGSHDPVVARPRVNLIEQDGFDRWEWAHLLSGSPVLQELATQGERQLETYPQLLQDLWASLYKLDPRRTPHVPTSHRANAEMLDAALQLPEWERLRQYTRLDPVCAAIALEAITSRLTIPALPEDPDDSQSWERWQGEVRRSLRRAAQDASGQVEQLAATEQWGAGLGSGQPCSPEERLALARKLQGSARLQQIAALAGRFTNIAFSKHASRTRHGVDDVVDVELGCDLARVLPAELARLGDPRLSLDFQRRFLERQLLQLELEGSEPVGRGPLVVCCDESGSMSGERDLWAKGVALALLAIAARERREFALIHFASAPQLQVDRFPHGAAGPAAALEAAAHFFGGGTDFDSPLARARALIEEDGTLRQADVVFITDGECQLEVQPVLASKQKLTYRIWGIAIECDAPVLATFCDGTVKVQPDTKGSVDVFDLLFH